MTAPTPAPPAAPAQEPATPATPVQATPPWGTDENFDASRAWQLIEGLKADKAALAARPAMSEQQSQQLSEYQQLVEASKSEAQRQQEALEMANRTAEQARADAIRYKAAATYGVPADHFDLLGTGTEEEVAARAAKISALIAAQVAAITTPTVTAPVTRPVEQLRPGATPAGATSEDDAVYAALFGSPT